LWLVVLLVVLYDAWVFYSRRERAHDAEQKRTEKESAEAKRTLELLGRLQILNFYSAPPVIPPGKTARLCYSVIDAKSVRIEPPVEGVYPALSRCVEVAPKRDTEYTLIASDEAGHTVSQKIAIKVSGSP
jgi:hypothetical protein